MNNQFLLAVSFLGLYASVTHGAALELASGAKQDEPNEFRMLVRIKDKYINWPNELGFAQVAFEIEINENMTWEELQKSLNIIWHKHDLQSIAITYGLYTLSSPTIHGLGKLLFLDIVHNFRSFRFPSSFDPHGHLIFFDSHEKVKNIVGIMDLLRNKNKQKRLSQRRGLLTLEIVDDLEVVDDADVFVCN